ncbi:hypothetical protein BSLG_000756 [Batrachochytrium salamandrivorans]|nr:hypothetical protein BSLG_000756 [Batrachochytrium salamandrivorans]
MEKWLAVGTEVAHPHPLKLTSLHLQPFLLQAKEIVLTPEMLAKYDGSDPSLPIYIAIKGIIYDVTEGRSYYGKKGSYEFFAGKDATRAYITGCFQADLTHDLRGLSDAQIESLSTWTDFYGKHDKYFQVGRVDNPPIDPASPVPEPCEG